MVKGEFSFIAATPMRKRDGVTAKMRVDCDTLPGHPSMPAEACVLRTLQPAKGWRRGQPQFPVCAACPVGKERRAELEAAGWVYDPEALQERHRLRRKAEKKAMRRFLLAADCGQ